MLNYKASLQNTELNRVKDITDAFLQDKTVVYPTDTVWAVGCLATSSFAIERLRSLKRRQEGKPFILLADSIDMVKKYVYHMHPRIETLLFYHQQPLTVVYDHGKNLPENAMGPDRSVAFRIVMDPWCSQLISDLGQPITSTSANFEGEQPPSSFEEISPEFLDQVDFIFEAAPDGLGTGYPSVIVRLDERGQLDFLRT